MSGSKSPIVAGRLGDFVEGVPRLVTGDETGSTAVVRWKGEFYAFRSVCPHQQGPIFAGCVRSPLTSERTGQAELDYDHPVVVCPWHRWEYDLATGRSIRRPGFRVRTYRAWLEGDLVMVGTRAKGNSRRGTSPGQVPGEPPHDEYGDRRA